MHWTGEFPRPTIRAHPRFVELHQSIAGRFWFSLTSINIFRPFFWLIKAFSYRQGFGEKRQGFCFVTPIFSHKNGLIRHDYPHLFAARASGFWQ